MQFLPGDGAGGAAATTHVRVAGEPSRLPAASLARTWNVCEPVASDEYDCGEAQATQAPPSRRHSNVESDSVDENAKLADRVVTVPVGPDAIEVSGGVASSGVDALIVQLREAGDASVFPAASVARTSNVCAPASSAEYDVGDAQSLHAPASRRHSNVEPGSLEANEMLVEPLVTSPLGPAVIDVSGGSRSCCGAGGGRTASAEGLACAGHARASARGRRSCRRGRCPARADACASAGARAIAQAVTVGVGAAGIGLGFRTS